MEKAMRAFLITAAAVAIASSAGAEPPKARVVPVRTESHSPVVLASAETINPAPAENAQRAPEPAKRVKPRVTTCRCGDPQPDAATPEQ
jgi:hypothetical protein